MLITAKIIGVGVLTCFLMAASPSTTSSVPKIADHTFEIAGGMLPGREPDGNTYVLESGKGLTIIDTGRHATHRRKIEMFAEEKHVPIVAVINTHWHLDHVSGNIGLRKANPDLKVYASDAIDEALTGFLAKSAESSRQMLSAGKLDPAQREDVATDLDTIEQGARLKPDVVLSHDETIVIGGRTLQVHVAKNAATAGDVWVFDARTGVVFVGDLVTFPVAFLDTACGAGWEKALGEIDRAPFRIVAPGHGPLLSREQFRTYSQAFAALLSCSASSQSAANCALSWIDQVATIEKISDSDRKLAEGMTVYYVTDVLRAHGGNSAYCAAAR